jgi:DNA-binding transcriptional ArsR family regulator
MSSSDVFRALADPTRLAVFESVVASEMSVSELTTRFNVSQPAISQHLATLRNCGLVAQRRAGKHIFYRAEPDGMKPKLPQLKALLKEMKHA